MNFFDSNQFFVFLIAQALGFVIGIYYDVFRIKRLMFGNGKVQLFFDDLLFTQTSCIIIIVYVFMANNGIYRWYEFISVLLGFALYRVTLSKTVMFVFEKLIFLLKLALRALLVPPRFIERYIFVFARFIWRKISVCCFAFNVYIHYYLKRNKMRKQALRGFSLLVRR